MKKREDTLHLVELRTTSGTTRIESRPEEDFGLDYDLYDEAKYVNKQKFYHDVQPVKIDELIEALNKLKSEGANYVTCSFHEDHLELEVTGFIIRLATDDEIEEHYEDSETTQKKILDSKIQKLEKELADLKNKNQI